MSFGLIFKLTNAFARFKLDEGKVLTQRNS